MNVPYIACAESARELKFRRLAASGVALSLICLVGAAGPAAAQEVLTAKLTNMTDGMQIVRLSKDHLKPDVVLFQVKNVSSNEDHELLLVKTDQPPQSLPMKADGTGVDESLLPGLKELGDLHPGQSLTTSVQLTPGRYLVFCNEPIVKGKLLIQ